MRGKPAWTETKPDRLKSGTEPSEELNDSPIKNQNNPYFNNDVSAAFLAFCGGMFSLLFLHGKMVEVGL